MYLAIVRDTHFFCFDDPRESGFDGQVTEVAFQENSHASSWPAGTEAPRPCLGQIGVNEYREFRSQQDLESCGYEFVTENFGVLQSDYSDCLQ
jgi:hypothetical protein